MDQSKNWKVAEPISAKILAKFPEIHPIILQLLFNRGIDSQEKIDQFLNPDYGDGLHDPFLFKDMEKAVKRILKAIEGKEKIVVYGDYDADGVCASAIMVSILKKLGAKVNIYIPYREKEGYGLNEQAVTELADQGTDLIITVDNGISNKGEVDILNKKKVDVIITDHHHQPLEIPKAFAIINPNLDKEKYPFKGLTGAGVAYKVAQAMAERQKDYKVEQLDQGWEKWLLDLVAIGTIADLQPLLDENRVLVSYGLIVLGKTPRPGLLELIKSLKNKTSKLDAKVVGWQISPRLNAAGRLNHASTAYELLITEDKDKAIKLARELNQTNQQRQQITEKILTEVKKLIGEVKDQKILIAVGQNWSIGVVGLVSGRISDMFRLPSLIISRSEGKIIGSGRSIEEFNMIEAIEKCHQYLDRYGGHAQACGFTVKDETALAEFIKKMTDLTKQELKGKKLAPTLEIDGQVDLENVNWGLFENLEKFEPFGEDNPKPRFSATKLTVVDTRTVGKDGNHLRLTIKHNHQTIHKTIAFSFGHWFDKLNKGDKIDIVFEIDVNEWNGNRELQLKIVDIKLGS